MLASNTVMVGELGLVVRESSGTLLVTRVVRGGRGEQAGVREGQYIVSIGGVDVASLYDLRRELRTHYSEAVDIEVTDGSPTAGSVWVGPSFSGLPITGQTDAQATFLGAFGALDVMPHVRFILGFGYTSIGSKLFSGRESFSPLFGVQTEFEVFDRFFVPFARVLLGPNITVTEGDSFIGSNGEFEVWGQQTLTVVGHFGVRIWWIEGAFSIGVGPATSINLGINITTWVPLGRIF